ncbi:fructose-6-phosphate aldolase [Vibrio parahaemolyticus]|uniref:transaldolase family protein n=2 Tax=Vibrio parahaemolyticus TaxID=670 RepID=UPI000429D33B|nr:transaldolase family protein [Vibrio parahaemolyticus]TNZ97117.1 fructose-6-phosphate aldolase [Vibrio parahaemolyticus]TOA17711.1 fructose-6-phosphate aldolase [Vibrio parahaemolyticus]TOB03978.1 fructose-6-phosphate aldolase [Vibrio parahaemolyticus]TOB81252.1 fructose-6-phosphate aldolase [Vibrio parahaemolyticus]HCG6474273.1 fructose-6-phosphate aldolase [Vibrio parahaemolyticus]
MIELYLDTADVAEVKRFNQCLPLKGVTTNPSILAKSKQGLNQTLAGMQEALGGTPRFHAQVVSTTVEGMVEEARQIHELPYDMVVKVPATETGLSAIKLMKKEGIQVLATAIYSAQQGFLAALCGADYLAALCGADYLAPYVNRIDAMNGNGVEVVADLQLLLDQNQLPTKILAASFKNTQQAMEVMKLGIEAITLPVDVAAQMFSHPAVQPAVDQFDKDWKSAFGNKLSFES